MENPRDPITIPGLPPVEVRCADCPSDDEITESYAEHDRWTNEQIDAFEAQQRYDRLEDWERSPEGVEFQEREPERLPDVGCVECDWTGIKLTEAGQALLAFVRANT